MFFYGSSQDFHHLSKAARGIAGSLDLFLEWDMILDDMGPKDFRADGVWPSHLAKARVASEARLHELFDSEYKPWEEVRDNWDHSDSEDVDNEVREFPNQCCRGSSAFTNFHFGEYSQSTVKVEARRMGLVVWELSPRTPWFLLVVLLRSPRLNIAFLLVARGLLIDLKGLKDFAIEQIRLLWGREFPLVRRHCLRNSDKRFRFFHKLSLSDVEVKVL
ncbi:hypothetical protein RHMOL_Rhmol04G0143000 [Rhododendron molle]|uniref:Uncharacterized protein n=1 Tax=Rhododendron molle TaxID=49168 RepID=A0ACC0P2P8_RHOML|nr:hypothetical protein RHMOL_Rhmol04G0143000 [Rhododendron molle]